MKLMFMLEKEFGLWLVSGMLACKFTNRRSGLFLLIKRRLYG